MKFLKLKTDESIKPAARLDRRPPQPPPVSSPVSTGSARAARFTILNRCLVVGFSRSRALGACHSRHKRHTAAKIGGLAHQGAVVDTMMD